MKGWVMPVPVLTSAHLTMATSMMLANGKIDSVVAAPYDEGMFLWVGHDPIPDDMPPDLQAFVLWAQQCGYDWVRLDAIGTEHPGLATYKDTWT